MGGKAVNKLDVIMGSDFSLHLPVFNVRMVPDKKTRMHPVSPKRADNTPLPRLLFTTQIQSPLALLFARQVIRFPMLAFRLISGLFSTQQKSMLCLRWSTAAFVHFDCRVLCNSVAVDWSVIYEYVSINWSSEAEDKLSVQVTINSKCAFNGRCYY